HDHREQPGRRAGHRPRGGAVRHRARAAPAGRAGRRGRRRLGRADRHHLEPVDPRRGGGRTGPQRPPDGAGAPRHRLARAPRGRAPRAPGGTPVSKTFETATDRLARLLTMVPWLLNRQGIDLASAAEQFGVSQEQIVDDLQLLFVCGTPGHLPDDLIEASWDEGRVHIANPDTIARPLRLRGDEALALIVALRALAQVPGVASHDAINRALAKLEAAAGEAARDTEQITVDLSADDERVQETLRRVRDALDRNRRLHLRYLVASRDESTERDVDPMRVLSVEGRWYLEAWCHRSQGVRTFRLDRIEELQVLDVD